MRTIVVLALIAFMGACTEDKPKPDIGCPVGPAGTDECHDAPLYNCRCDNGCTGHYHCNPSTCVWKCHCDPFGCDAGNTGDGSTPAR